MVGSILPSFLKAAFVHIQVKKKKEKGQRSFSVNQKEIGIVDMMLPVIIWDHLYIYTKISYKSFFDGFN